MPRNDRDNNDFFWYLLIGILTSMAFSEAEPQATSRPDTGRLAALAILARHDSAVGRVGGESRLRFAHMISETQAPAIKTTTETWTMAPNRILTRITMEGSVTMEVGYNGTVGWTDSPITGPVLLQGEPLKLLAAQAGGRGQLDKAFKTLSAGRRTVVEGRDVVPVRFEDDAGNGGTFFFDSRTRLLHAMSQRIREAAPDTMWTLFSDYKRVDGEMFAATTTIKGHGQSIVTRVTHVDHKAIDTTLFSPPSAVRAMLNRP